MGRGWPDEVRPPFAATQPLAGCNQCRCQQRSEEHSRPRSEQSPLNGILDEENSAESERDPAGPDDPARSESFFETRRLRRRWPGCLLGRVRRWWWWGWRRPFRRSGRLLGPFAGNRHRHRLRRFSFRRLRRGWWLLVRCADRRSPPRGWSLEGGLRPAGEAPFNVAKPYLDGAQAAAEAEHHEERSDCRHRHGQNKQSVSNEHSCSPTPESAAILWLVAIRRKQRLFR